MSLDVIVQFPAKMSERQTRAGNLVLSLSLVDPRDMLNKFLYAQKSLFIGENANANFCLPITTTSVSVTFEPIELVPS